MCTVLLSLGVSPIAVNKYICLSVSISKTLMETQFVLLVGAESVSVVYVNTAL